MKRLVFAIVGVLIIVPLLAAGCTGKEPAGIILEEGGVVVSSCVTCHTDKEVLKAVANPEPEEEQSEATSGEG